MMAAVKPLFGGHLAAWLPADARDISEIREVPDNQEVFTHAVTDQSVMVDILQLVEEPDEEALRTHFEDIAGSNEASGQDNSQVLFTESIPHDKIQMTQCSSCWYLGGEQKVSKFNESAKNVINTHIGLFRLPQFDTDIVVTFNDPLNIDPDSSSHGAVPTTTQPWTVADFRQILTSLQIVNTDIFG